jgi:hypothetical protein
MTKDEIRRRVEIIRNGCGEQGPAAWAELLFELQLTPLPTAMLVLDLLRDLLPAGFGLGFFGQLSTDRRHVVAVASAIDAAIAEERIRCIKIVESHREAIASEVQGVDEDIVRAIRKG